MTITVSDPKKAITVTKKDDSCYLVKMYLLSTSELVFEERVEGDYIKMKDLE